MLNSNSDEQGKPWDANHYDLLVAESRELRERWHVVAEALEKWTKSGNDPTILRGAELTWKTPGGGTETGFVGAVADR